MAATASNFTPSTSNVFIRALAIGVRFDNSAPITYYIKPSDHDGDGLNDWDLHDARGGLHIALDAWTSVANITFQQVQTAGQANWIEEILPPGSFGTAYHYFPNSVLGQYGGAYDLLPNSDPGENRIGGEYVRIFLHEIGHGLGLDHTHSGGTSDQYFPGALSDDDRGAYDLNGNATSVMSYVDNHRELFGSSFAADWGYIATPMAFDIAAAQAIYGANMNTGAGNDIYDLPTANGIGTYIWCIWDAGGTDTIRYQGSGASVLDMRAATLEVGPGGGGFFSQAAGIVGAFSIANGVVIENAIGGSGADLIVGNEAGNDMQGNAGADTIAGHGGADTLRGGEGADTFLYYSATDSTAAASDRIMDFTSGSDRIDLRLIAATGFSVAAEGGATRLNAVTPAGVFSLLVEGSFTLEQLLPGAVAATIDVAANGAGAVTGTGGADLLHGLGGADNIAGGEGGDFIVGGAGADTLSGDAGGDTIHGGNGTDTLFDAEGHDLIDGGAGDDLLLGELGNDTLYGRDGSDTIDGGYGDDVIDPGLGSATIDGGPGTDILRLSEWTTAFPNARWNVATNGTKGSVQLVGQFTLQFSDIERFDFQMGSGNDFAYAAWHGENTIRAGAGNDTIGGGDRSAFLYGEDGNDEIWGGFEADWIEGGNGDDTIDGYLKNDTIDGGAGNDRVNYSAAFEACIITFAGEVCIVQTPDEGTDRLTNVETLAFNGVVKSVAALRAANADVTPPVLQGVSPVDGATGVSVTADIVLTFSEAIKRGAGIVELRRSDGVLVESFDVATSNRLTISPSGVSLIVDPTYRLAAGTHYVLSVASGAITDLSGNAYAGLVGNDFTTLANPSSSVNPARFVMLNAMEGAVGSGASVFGTQAFQDLTIIDQPGAITLDGSFAIGGDLIRLTGTASAYSARTAGSFAILSDGDTQISIPVGTAGASLLFDDGLRTLLFANDAVRLGGQAIGDTASPITALPESGPIPGGSDPSISGRLAAQAGSVSAVGGKLDIFGIGNANEIVEVLYGDVTFDGSFARGGDIVILDAVAGAFTAFVSGSFLVLETDDLIARIPVGTAGMTIRFADEDRTLVFDIGQGLVKVGAQTVGAVEMPLMPSIAASPPSDGSPHDHFTHSLRPVTFA